MQGLKDPICVVIHPGGVWVYVLSKGYGYGAIVLFRRGSSGTLSKVEVAASMYSGNPAGSPQSIHQAAVRAEKPANDGLAMTKNGDFLYATGILSDGLAQYVLLPGRVDVLHVGKGKEATRGEGCYTFAANNQTALTYLCPPPPPPRARPSVPYPPAVAAFL